MQKNAQGRTPLHIAAANNDVQAIEILLTRYAQIDSIDKNGQTPLQIAECHGAEDAVHSLMARGATIEKIGDPQSRMLRCSIQ